MSTAQKIHVQIGEVKTGGPGQVLTAILGSCIGLGLLLPSRNIYGLAHCLLSNSGSTTSCEISGRHVDQALRSLVALMKIKPEESRKIKALVVGGANMTMPEATDPARLVGTINSNSAYKAVRGLGVFNIYEDTGGMVGRQVTIDCTTGGYQIAEIPRLGGGNVRTAS